MTMQEMVREVFGSKEHVEYAMNTFKNFAMNPTEEYWIDPEQWEAEYLYCAASDAARFFELVLQEIEEVAE